MISFDPRNPFVFLPLESYSYKEAQDHSVSVDDHLGFRLQEVEERIRARTQEIPENNQNWDHLSVQAFQTPYVELRNILELLNLKPQDHVVDLGCAYARMAFVMGTHFPEIVFSGYELEKERVEETLRVLKSWPAQNISVYTANLALESFVPPQADVYFIFDYGNEDAVSKTLRDLQTVARERSIQVVARGRLSRFLIHRDHPWLAEIETPRHFAHFSIYHS